MSATYDPTLPAALDRMRYVLGDTTVTPESAALIPDETYLAMLTLYTEPIALATLARGLATKYAQQPSSIGTDGDSFSWSDRVKTWLAIAESAESGPGSTSWAYGSFVLDYLEPAESGG